MIQKAIFLIILYLGYFGISKAQQNYSSSLIKSKIDKLSTLGTALYFAAHPDDENTRLIAWLANQKNYRTAYLSLTRGDGGQNLLGTEQGIDLGLIRTQELLAARKIDKGEQYFSSAYDFGFSKTYQETFTFWKQQETLKEAVYLIRKLQPDIIINRFPPDTRGGHGHHQASAILAKQAYLAAADPNMFPEQLVELKPWKAKRMVWNTFNFGGEDLTSDDQIKLEIGDYNPLLGYSYGEIAALSRSEHKSQGFGAARNRGSSTEYFEAVAGDPAKSDLFEGINDTWSRLGPGTNLIQNQITEIKNSYNIEKPELSVVKLSELYRLIEKLEPSVYKTQKLQDIREIIVACAGLWVEANTTKNNFVIGESLPVSNELIVQNPNLEVIVKSINGKLINQTLPFNKNIKFSEQKSYSTWTQPYWLEKPHSLGKFQVAQKDYNYPENPHNPSSTFELQINGITIEIQRPISYKYVDPVQGEIYEPVSISPEFTASLNSANLLIQNEQKKQLTVTIKNQSSKKQKGNLTFNLPEGLNISEKSFEIAFEPFQEVTRTIDISSQPQFENGDIELFLDGKKLSGYKRIDYPHIPAIVWFPPVEVHARALALNNPVKLVGYIPGAGDLIPASLENIGIQVDQLNPSQLTSSNLEQYQAIILGVRSYNVNKTIASSLPKLLDYVKQGGTVLVQYNVNARLQTSELGPYPFKIVRDRVTEEDAKVTVLLKDDPALNFPNKITSKDFENWIQERGLYFASEIDSHYRTPISIADKNEPQNNGSLLIAKYGKGKFVYTSLSFFRQLPAGVPGAYRLFVNLLATEETN